MTYESCDRNVWKFAERSVRQTGINEQENLWEKKVREGDDFTRKVATVSAALTLWWW